jgi:hypothetical protein
MLLLRLKTTEASEHPLHCLQTRRSSAVGTRVLGSDTVRRSGNHNAEALCLGISSLDC